MKDDAIEHFEMGEASDDTKDSGSEVSKSQDDEEVRSLRRSKKKLWDNNNCILNKDTSVRLYQF